MADKPKPTKVVLKIGITNKNRQAVEATILRSGEADGIGRDSKDGELWPVHQRRGVTLTPTLQERLRKMPGVKQVG